MDFIKGKHMITKKLASSLLAVFSVMGAAHAAPTPTTVNGGTVHFTGEVVNAACAVDAGSLDQTVQLGQVKSTSLAVAGNTSSSVGFNIQLDDCDASIASTAAVAFSGTAVSSIYNTALALQTSAAGGATFVGIQILDATSNPMVLDGNTFSEARTISNGTNVIPFQARYIATGVATAGVADADATFKVQYQ